MFTRIKLDSKSCSTTKFEIRIFCMILHLVHLPRFCINYKGCQEYIKLKRLNRFIMRDLFIPTPLTKNNPSNPIFIPFSINLSYVHVTSSYQNNIQHPSNIETLLTFFIFESTNIIKPPLLSLLT